MNKKELIEISDKMLNNIRHYVIPHDFTLEVYNITNDKLNKKLVLNGDRLDIMFDFTSYMFDKIIIQITVISIVKTIKVFVRDKVE